eukprot:3044456-Rhodomonas_salina.2
MKICEARVLTPKISALSFLISAASFCMSSAWQHRQLCQNPSVDFRARRTTYLASAARGESLGVCTREEQCMRQRCCSFSFPPVLFLFPALAPCTLPLYLPMGQESPLAA